MKMKKGDRDGFDDDEVTAKRSIRVQEPARLPSLQTISLLVGVAIGCSVIVGWIAVAKNIPTDIAELKEWRRETVQQLKDFDEQQQIIFKYIERDQSNASGVKERLDACCPLYSPRRRP